MLHHPKLYPHIHKIHHEYNITVSIASEYAHPLEILVANILPTALGAKILGSKMHILTYFMWLVIRVMETCDGHCGYEFSWSPYRLLPLSGSSNYHNFHHYQNVGNYGSFFTLWDTICGTNRHYFKFLSKKEKKEIAARISHEYQKMQEQQINDPAQKVAKNNEAGNTPIKKVHFDTSFPEKAKVE